MQNSSNARLTTYITLLGTVVSLLQYLACRFIGTPLIILLISVILLGVGSVLLIFGTQDYESCFGFQLICVLFQILIILTSYDHPNSGLPENTFLILLCFLNWFVPALVSFLLYLLQHSAWYNNYTLFFCCSTVIFVFAYIAFLGYGLFWNNAAYHSYQPETATFSLLPFATIAAKIEAVILGTEGISSLVYYLLSHILLYVPYGFLLALVLRPLPIFVRLPGLLVFPVLTDVVQYIFRLGHSDIDDIILGFIGALFGMLCLLLLDLLCKAVTGSKYLEKEERNNYYRSNIHY